MSPDEQKLLEELFERTRAAQDTQRDPQAETLINEAIRTQPHAPYLLSQAVILQDQALRSAASHLKELEQRIAELESRGEQPQRSGGSFLGGLGGLFGSQPPSSSQPASSQPAYAQQPASAGPWGSDPRPAAGPWGAAAPSPAGGFLRGAMGTAAGVAGGMLLANSLGGLFGGNHGLFGGTGGLAGPQEVIEENVVNNNYFGNGDATADTANSAGNDDSLSNADFSDDSSNFSDDSFDV